MLDFITRHKDEPFFCYYPMMLTHSPFEPTPDAPPGMTKKSPVLDRMVGMVAYTDKIVGRVVAHLDSLGIRDNTVILFQPGDPTREAGESRHANTKRILDGISYDRVDHPFQGGHVAVPKFVVRDFGPEEVDREQFQHDGLNLRLKLQADFCLAARFQELTKRLEPLCNRAAKRVREVVKNSGIEQ